MDMISEISLSRLLVLGVLIVMLVPFAFVDTEIGNEDWAAPNRLLGILYLASVVPAFIKMSWMLFKLVFNKIDEPPMNYLKEFFISKETIGFAIFCLLLAVGMYWTR